MRVALVHDYLNQIGGAERVLAVLVEMFPKAPIYTLLHDKKKMRGMFSDREIKTSFLDLPFVRSHHRLFIPIMPHAIRTMHLGSKFDLIISDSASFAKGIPHDKNTKHLCYCHTPLRYVWETDTYFSAKGGSAFGGDVGNMVFRNTFKPLFRYVKTFDYRFAQYPDVMLANSHFIAGKIKEYYHRTAEVVYPPVDLKKFYYDPIPPFVKGVPEGRGIFRGGGFSQKSLPAKPALPLAQGEEIPPASGVLPLGKGEYFLAVGRFLPYKKFDLIIRAFNKNGLPLIIVGAGRDEKKLKALAISKQIKFLPYQSDEQLRKLYSGAKCLIFPHVEDFGLVAAEAIACGCPVIAFKGGGIKEIVIDGKNGIFFSDQTISGLTNAIERFVTMTFDRKAIAKTAERFSKEVFIKKMEESIHRLMG